MDLAEEMAALQVKVDNNREVLLRILKRADEAEALSKVHGNDYAFGFLLASVRILSAAHL
jgi:hypothetical protein